MLQISTITQPPPQNKWILCLKLPIPNILISPGNKFRCILKLDLSTKWSFSFSFQGKKMDPQMTHQNGWSYMNVEIPTSQQLKQMPKIEGFFFFKKK